MAKQEEGWLNDKIDRLERRLKHHRSLADSLPPDAILKTMNDRAIFDMEMRLFQMKTNRRLGSAAPHR